MFDREKILKKIIDDYTGDKKDLASHITTEYKKYEDITRKINNLESEKARLNKQHKESIKKIEIDIFEVRKTCNHIDRSFYGDPSGGHDSYYECNICGKELTRFDK